jgi:hypothetical protein
MLCQDTACYNFSIRCKVGPFLCLKFYLEGVENNRRKKEEYTVQLQPKMIHTIALRAALFIRRYFVLNLGVYPHAVIVFQFLIVGALTSRKKMVK